MSKSKAARGADQLAEARIVELIKARTISLRVGRLYLSNARTPRESYHRGESLFQTQVHPSVPAQISEEVV